MVSFLCIVIVFFIHSSFPEEPYKQFLLPNVVRKCTAGIFGPCAVPMFYTISGFLFFRGVEGSKIVLKKIRRRIRTLIIPFILAAFYYPVFFVLMEILPGVGNYIDRPSFIELFKSLTLPEILCSMFYGASDGYPWAYHLWFMRDLIIIVFLSPVVFFIKKWIGCWIIAVILFLYISFPSFWFLYAMFWFVSGSVVLGKMGSIPRWIFFPLLFLFFMMAIYRQLNGDYSYIFFNVIEISMGLVSFWCLYDYVTHNHLVFVDHDKLKLACQFTFFLYLYHEPIFHILVKLLIMVLGTNSLGYTMAITLPPFFIILLGVIIGCRLRNRLPRMYSVITGGR